MVGVVVGRYRPTGVDDDFRGFPISVAGAESLTVALGVICLRHHQPVGITVFRVLLEEILTGISHSLPVLLSVGTEPGHQSGILLYGSFVGCRRFLCLKVRSRCIEQRTGRKLKHPCLQCECSGSGHSSVVRICDSPRKLFRCLLAHIHNKIHTLSYRSAGIVRSHFIFRGGIVIQNRHSSEMTEHLVHLKGYDHPCLTFANFFLLISHIGDPVHIVDENPRAPDSCPGAFLIRKKSEFSGPRILPLGIVGACIVGLDNTSPGAVALHQVGHCVKIVPADFVTSVLEFVPAVVGMDCQTGAERGVCTDEFSLGKQLRRKDLLKCHIRSRRLLEKGVTEFEVAA